MPCYYVIKYHLREGFIADLWLVDDGIQVSRQIIIWGNAILQKLLLDNYV